MWQTAPSVASVWSIELQRSRSARTTTRPKIFHYHPDSDTFTRTYVDIFFAWLSGADGKCTLCHSTEGNHYQHSDGKKYCDSGVYCCTCRIETNPSPQCNGRASVCASATGGSQKTRPVAPLYLCACLVPLSTHAKTLHLLLFYCFSSCFSHCFCYAHLLLYLLVIDTSLSYCFLAFPTAALIAFLTAYESLILTRHLHR